MIGKLKGIVEAMGENTIVLDVNGVGYEVHLSARSLRSLNVGDVTSITIDTHVREDAIRLYGFLNEVERSWFRLLQTVQGVGSKVALGILGVLSPSDLANALALQNWSAVEEAPGVGKKLAQRIVAELKDKAPVFSGAGLTLTQNLNNLQPGEKGRGGQAAAEAISALSNLGYHPLQSSSAIAAALKDLGATANTAELIRRGLKELSR